MPVTTKHKQYLASSERWIRCRDIIGGSDVVKKKGVEYLPSLDKQTSTMYEAYKSRATFYNASGRTVQGLMGAVFRKDPVWEYPFDEHVKAITPARHNLTEFSRNVMKEVITVGRNGVLVDVHKDHDIRAYAAAYTAENITNWEVSNIDGQLKYTMVVLRETFEEKKLDDIFEKKAGTQYRVLRLTPIKETWQYHQEVWRKKENADIKEAWYIHETITPTKGGIPLDFIPFIIINVHDLTSAVDRPPLLDLVDVNLSHYRTSADLEHGAHFTALPTPWLAGFSTSGSFTIGSGVAWVTEDTNAKAGMLEYTGQGLGALRDLKGDKEQLMSVLGARMLEQQKKAVEAADTLRIRMSGESGALNVVTGTVSDGIKTILEWVAWWSNATDGQINKIEFELNKDFVDAEISPQIMQQLLASLQSNKISLDTFLYNLKEGELLPPDRTIEQEKDLLDNEPDDLDYPNNVEGNIQPIRKKLAINRDDNGKAVSVEEV